MTISGTITKARGISFPDSQPGNGYGFPQFHIQHRDFFDTFLPTAGNSSTLSHWKYISGFKIDRPHHIKTQEVGSGTYRVIPYQVYQESVPQVDKEYHQDSDRRSRNRCYNPRRRRNVIIITRYNRY